MNSIGLSNPGAFQPARTAAGGLLGVLNINIPFWNASDRGSINLIDATGVTFAASFHRFVTHELVHALTYLTGSINGDVLPWTEEGTATATP